MDWGVGHTTRCIPIIAYFLEKECEVHIAGNTFTNAILRPIFPQLQYHFLNGYDVQYSKYAWALPFKIFIQIPKILIRIFKEKKWLENFITQYQIDIVISDNRYGLFSQKTTCVFITHQLHILAPQFKFIEKLMSKSNYFFLKKYSQIWVPDYENNMQSGKLSKPDFSIPNLKYIGNLSRFELQDGNNFKKNKIAIILSGPEPQRTILEQILLSQIEKSNYQFVLVKGKKNETISKNISHLNNLIVFDFLSQNELQKLILNSELIICRSGYSSVMDLIKLNKNAILIPTPGQTEQEYLAKYLTSQNWFLTYSQNEIIIDKIIEDYKMTAFEAFPNIDFELYKKVIDTLFLETEF